MTHPPDERAETRDPLHGRGVSNSSGQKRVPKRGWAGVLILPGSGVLAAFFFYPMLVMVWRSFSRPQLGFSNYVKLWTDGVSVHIILRSLLVALIVSVSCLVLAYPYAYVMSRVSRRARGILIAVVLLPFWTSLMARTFAWYLLESRGGVIDRITSLPTGHGLVLLSSLGGVTLAMVQVMLPYMVLPLYSSMSSIDYRLMDAAGSLGARKTTAFRTVYMPLSLPGITAGFSLVYILTLGFYITPQIVGSQQEQVVGQEIANKVNTLLDFPTAGAEGVVLLTLTIVILLVVQRGLGRLGGKHEGGSLTDVF